MEKKGFINKFFQNAGKPEGFLGRMILRGMNKGHAPLSRWARSCLVRQPERNTLDIGCGGGANLSEILKLCPQGKVHGIDGRCLLAGVHQYERPAAVQLGEWQIRT